MELTRTEKLMVNHITAIIIDVLDSPAHHGGYISWQKLKYKVRIEMNEIFGTFFMGYEDFNFAYFYASRKLVRNGRLLPLPNHKNDLKAVSDRFILKLVHNGVIGVDDNRIPQFNISEVE